MIRSFQGTIRSYHGMIRPFQDTNYRFKLNALYNVIILVRSSFILSSSFVRDSFGIRSGFVRDSKNNQRSYENASEAQRRHNKG